jgi:hypothetical protein
MPRTVLAAMAGLAMTAVLGATPASAAQAPGCCSALVVSAWAKVTAAGGIISAAGLTGSVNKFGIGRYNIGTITDLTGCALMGTINSSGGSDPGPGSSSIMVAEVDTHTLFVRTSTPSSPGNASVDDDRPFSVIVFCWQP